MHVEGFYAIESGATVDHVLAPSKYFAALMFAARWQDAGSAFSCDIIPDDFGSYYEYDGSMEEFCDDLTNAFLPQAPKEGVLKLRNNSRVAEFINTLDDEPILPFGACDEIKEDMIAEMRTYGEPSSYSKRLLNMEG
jgi:hypothetical protein